MIYETSNQKVNDMITSNGDSNTYRIGVVSLNSVTKEVYVNFKEGDINLKSYKFLNSYNPKDGDCVLLLKTGRTYVILGKLEKFYDKT